MKVWPSSMRTDESGAAIITFAVTASVMLGMSALAVSGGVAYSTKQKSQNALDAAVLAGAALPYGSSDDARISVAQSVYRPNQQTGLSSKANFSVDALPDAVFTVSDTKVFGSTVVELKSPFLKVFGHSSLNISATSAAQKSKGDPACVVGLDPTEEATFDFNGHANVDIKDCAAQANSTSGEGMRQVGQPSMKAKAIGVTGGYSGTAYQPQPITGTSPLQDPLASLPEPSTGQCHPLSGAKLSQANTMLTPGTYCGGLEVKSQSVIVLMPGEYVFLDGPLKIDSGSSVAGNNVLLAFLGPTSTLYLYSGAKLIVTSPNSGTYKNIQFFGDRKVYEGPGGNGANGTSLWFTVIGDSKLIYDGTLYAPSFYVWWAGGSLIQGKSPNYIAISKKLWFQDHTQVRLSLENTRSLDVPEAVSIQFGAALFK